MGSSLGHSNDELMAAPEQTELLDEVLARVTCPVVIVHGTKDSLVPYANVEYMRSAFVNAASIDIVTLDGADHFIPWTHVQAIRDAIESLVFSDGRN